MQRVPAVQDVDRRDQDDVADKGGKGGGDQEGIGGVLAESHVAPYPPLPSHWARPNTRSNPSSSARTSLRSPWRSDKGLYVAYAQRWRAFGADHALSAADLPTAEQRVAPKNRMGLC
jgi:hypothetical protein